MLRFSFTNINDCGEFLFQLAPTISARKRDRKIKLYGDLRGDGLGDRKDFLGLRSRPDETVNETVKLGFRIHSIEHQGLRENSSPEEFRSELESAFGIWLIAAEAWPESEALSKSDSRLDLGIGRGTEGKGIS